MRNLLYGAAYYDEYMPYERLETDIEMMKKAGMNVVRIAESTWSTEEPQNGVFDFSHVKRVLEATGRAGISVIVGTPTYAVPPWLAAAHPEVIAVTERGPGKYGARQNMDITSPAYLFHAERVIRKLLDCVQEYPNVIGFQLDNETKHYGTAGANVQKRFAAYLREKFGTVEAMNSEFGFSYWSNSMDCWENLPDVTGTINWSFKAEFEKFRRLLVNEFLMWQSGIVREYLKEGQFITHNFDFEWRGYSYGMQPDVNHKSAARAVTIAGCDIYHPSQDALTGTEISFCGDVTRSLKSDNYLVLETEAQGFAAWTPYDGQLRQQAFSHIASGAESVMYWHWHSIHNSFETYWKGLLSHDMRENRPYREACTIGADFKRLSPKLCGLKKKNQVAVLLSNESLTALRLFTMPDGKTGYNDFVRWMYDSLYELNVECDILFPDCEDFGRYKLIAVPALYSASQSLLEKLRDYVRDGGRLITSFKSGFSNEHLKVSSAPQPDILRECCGVSYDEFALPENVSLEGDSFGLSEDGRKISLWMELLRPEGAEVISSYRHKFWGGYAAVTRNSYGGGSAVYIGCLTSKEYLKVLLSSELKAAGLWGTEQQAAFPVIIKSAENPDGKNLRFYFNYSGECMEQPYLHGAAVELISGKSVQTGDTLSLEPWGFRIFEEA